MRDLKEKILTKTTEYDIFSHYLNLMGFPGNFLGKTIRSPFRNEKHPSFSIFKGNHNSLFFKDFAGDSGDVWKFVSMYYEVYCNRKMQFHQLLIATADEMGLIGLSLRGRKLYKQKPIVILPEVRRALENLPETTMVMEDVAFRAMPTGSQVNYMGKYGFFYFENNPNIGIQDVDVIIKVSDGKIVKTEQFRSTTDNPVFTFKAESFFDNSTAFRVYQPLAPKGSEIHKHYGNVKSHHIYYPEKYPSLITHQLTRFGNHDYHGDTVVLMGGYKDALLFNEFLPFNACSTGGESWNLHQSFIDWLKRSNLKPILFYDNDDAGRMAAKKLSELHGIPICNFLERLLGNPSGHIKDFSDYAEIVKEKENYKGIQEHIITIRHNADWTKWNL